jgi:hypothetical protein
MLPPIAQPFKTSLCIHQELLMPFSISSCARFGAGIIAATAVVLLSGCGTATETAIPAAMNGGFHGLLVGGRQPISGSTITVWATGSTGYGSAATSLASTTSNGSGYFSIPAGTYTCPSLSTPLYITAQGGNPGNTPNGGNPTGDNPDVLLVATLGVCGPAEENSFIVINEVTTVASAFALSGFMTPANFGTSTNIGIADAIGAPYSATPTFASNNNNLTGLSNAVTTAGTLASMATGGSPGGAANATVDSAKIDTMANVLAACTNTDPVNGSTTCSTLFTQVSPASSTATPTASNTFEAAYYLCANPTSTNGSGSNLTAVFNTAVANAPFMPALTSAPNDWTVGVNYAVPSLTAAQRLAIDATGNVWVTSSGQVSEISPAGGVTTFTGAQGTTTITTPYGVAADLNGNVLVTDSGTNQILQFSSTSDSYVGSIAGATVTGEQPYGIAFDKNNKAWITENTTNSVSTTVGILEGCTYTAGAFCTSTTPAAGANTGGEGALAVALDKNSTIFTPSRYQSLAGTGSTATSGAIRNWNDSSGAGSNNVAYGTSSPVKAFFPTGAVFDATGNMWFSNTAYLVSGGTTYGSSPTNSFLTMTPVTYNTYPTPDTVAAATSAAVKTYTGGGMNAAVFVAIDGSSNLWVANSGGYTPGSTTTYSVSELSNTGAALSPANSGFVHTMVAPNDIAVDASGNVWVANGGAVSYVTEIVGAASPAVTPIALNTKYGTWGTRP